MANKLIQMKDGNDSVFPNDFITIRNRVNKPCTTTYQSVDEIALPSGLKLVYVLYEWNSGQPTQLGAKINYGGSYRDICHPDIGTDANNLCLLFVTKADNFHVFATSSNAFGSGLFSVGYKLINY